MAKKEQKVIGTEEMRLEVQLSEDEKIQAGKDLAENLQDIADLTYDLEAEKKRLKGRIEEHKGEVSRLAYMVNRGAERRLVNCIWTPHETEVDVKILVRVDTGEIVDERVMTDEDRQVNLPVED